MDEDTKSPGQDPEATRLESTEAADAPSSQGLRVGPYLLLEKVGEGGMGEVWLARQEAPIRRRVALKVIKLGMDTKQVIARFEAERQALALMNHPNVARVYDAGSTEMGRPYFAMEYVQGEPITAYCDRHRLTTRERLLLFMQVCDGIQHAHQKGIIHRDIKPSNVLVYIQDDRAAPKIIDFGVAKATQQQLTERTLHTQMGVLIGTPEYMSPEQAEMTGLDVDTRTDVYSLGVLLYELLIGTLPFDSKKLREAGFDEIRRRIREEEPSRPSTRISTLGDEAKGLARRRHAEPRTWARQLRGDLDWITMKALEKDRTRRYSSPSELAADIARHLNNEVVLALPPSRTYRLRKTLSRHKAGFAVLFGVLGILVGALTVSTRLYLQAEAARLEEVRQSYAANLMITASSVRDNALDAAWQRLQACSKRFRGWEWWHLKLQAQPRLTDCAVELPLPSLKAAAVDPTGRHVAGGFQDGSVQVWNAASCETLHAYHEHRGTVSSIVFTPDGKTVVSGSHDGSVLLFSLDAFEPRVVDRDDAGVTTLALSPDGRWLAIGLLDRTKLFDLHSERFVKTLKHGGSVTALAFSDDRSKIAAGFFDGEVKLWSTATWTPLPSLEGHTEYVTSLTFDSEGERLASSSGDATVRVWDLSSERSLTLEHDGFVDSVRFMADGRKLLSRTRAGRVQTWDADTARPDEAWSLMDLDEPRNPAELVVRPMFREWFGLFPRSADGFMTLGRRTLGEQALRLYEVLPRATVFRIESETPLELSGDGAFLLTAVTGEKPISGGTLRLPGRESPAGGMLRVRSGVDGRILTSLEFRGQARIGTVSRDGRLVAIGSSDNAVRIWDVPSGELISILRGHQHVIDALAFSPDGETLVSGARDDEFRLWNVRSQQTRASVTHTSLTSGERRFLSDSSENLIPSVTFAPDGKRVALVDNAWIQVWDIETEKLLALDNGGEHLIRSVTFSPDGRRVLGGGSDGKIRIWSAASGELLETLAGHGGAVLSAATSPDGTRIISTSMDATVRVWDLDRGAPLLSLRGHEAPVRFAAFSGDGRRVVSSSVDGTLRIWNTPLSYDPRTR